MKKIFTFLFALMACVASTFAWDYERVRIDDLYYNLDTTNQTAEVTCQVQWGSDNYSGLETVIIPESIEHDSIPYRVTSIGTGAFYNCANMTSIIIPNSVTNIKWAAFKYCSGLTSIEIPNSVTSIGPGAFTYCSGLTNPVYNDHVFAYLPMSYSGIYTIPDGIESISGEAFFCCFDLISVVIPNSVTNIGSGAFIYCTGLTSITLPNSVTVIEGSAFQDCSNLTSIVIPNSVNIIESGAFSGCIALESIVVEHGNNIYDSRENCNALIETASNTLIAGCKNTYIPNSVTIIGQMAFAYCYSMTSITIPNNVTSVEFGAFDGCFGLTSITIPNSVTYIGERAFNACSGLMSIFVEDGNINYDSRENCNALIETASNTLIVGCQNTIISTSITCIGDEAFKFCNYLTSITIPNSVTSIGNEAFYNCTGLTTLTIPSNVTTIGFGAFNYCSDLTSISCEAVTPPICGWDAFANVSKSIPLYVPKGSVSSYQTANEWSDFTYIVGIEFGIEEITQQTKENAQKLLRNNQIIILRGDKTYTLTGQQIK